MLKTFREKYIEDYNSLKEKYLIPEEEQSLKFGPIFLINKLYVAAAAYNSFRLNCPILSDHLNKRSKKYQEKYGEINEENIGKLEKMLKKEKRNLWLSYPLYLQSLVPLYVSAYNNIENPEKLMNSLWISTIYLFGSTLYSTHLNNKSEVRINSIEKKLEGMKK